MIGWIEKSIKQNRKSADVVNSGDDYVVSQWAKIWKRVHTDKLVGYWPNEYPILEKSSQIMNIEQKDFALPNRKMAKQCGRALPG